MTATMAAVAVPAAAKPVVWRQRWQTMLRNGGGEPALQPHPTLQTPPSRTQRRDACSPRAL